MVDDMFYQNTPAMTTFKAREVSQCQWYYTARAGLVKWVHLQPSKAGTAKQSLVKRSNQCFGLTLSIVILLMVYIVGVLGSG